MPGPAAGGGLLPRRLPEVRPDQAGLLGSALASFGASSRLRIEPADLVAAGFRDLGAGRELVLADQLAALGRRLVVSLSFV